MSEMKMNLMMHYVNDDQQLMQVLFCFVLFEMMIFFC